MSHSITPLQQDTQSVASYAPNSPTQKTLGIIGGMSWESTATYYRLINEGVRTALGGLHSAPLLIHSLDFASVAAQQASGDWQGLTQTLVRSGQQLRVAGAQGLLIATNTMHKVADEVQSATGLPLIHIADSTAHAITTHGLQRVALLGTAFTMSQDFYKDRLATHGVSVLIPDQAGQAEVHRIIYDELCQGIITDASRQRYVQIIKRLASDGAQGVILGCTEIGLLINQADIPIPVFDTTAIHAAAAVAFILGKGAQSIDDLSVG